MSEHFKKFLLVHPVDDFYTSFFVRNLLKKEINLEISYWCTVEHFTPSENKILLCFVVFPSPVSMFVLEKHFPGFHIMEINVDSPIYLYREYLLKKGFKYNLGRSKVIRGTFFEKKGGF